MARRSSSTEKSRVLADDPTTSCCITFLTWFNPYRQILIFVVLLNITGLILASQNVWKYPRRDPATLVTVNILIAVAARSEWVMRFVYWIVIKLFRRWTPISFRTWIVGVLYHIGGLHSGCGTSALIWLSWATGRNFYHHARYNVTILLILALIFFCILATCVTAIPILRGPHHNFFELTHRFIGWAGVVFTWLYVILISCWDTKRMVWEWSWDNVMRRPEFWCTYASTMLIGAAWISVDKIPVICTAVSSSTTVVRCPQGLTSGVLTRVSMGGLREWHVFGTISEGKHATCHYFVAANKGTFTNHLNQNLPDTLYTRRWKLCGLPYFSRLFSKGIAICTGTGIGAIGSTCIQNDQWFLIWIGSTLEETYGEELCTFIKNGTKGRSLIWDTKKQGRPDVLQLLEATFVSWEAEVAFFIGSPKLNNDVLKSCKSRRIPAFGSIWDA